MEGDTNLDLLVDLGGNTIRTWGVDEDTKKLLDRAEELGVMVTLGLWVEHKRHGFDYTDKKDIDTQSANEYSNPLKNLRIILHYFAGDLEMKWKV